MLKKLLGIAPKLESDGSFSPSKFAIKTGVPDTTDFENISYQKYRGKKNKILVICTEEKNLKMKNFIFILFLINHFLVGVFSLIKKLIL